MSATNGPEAALLLLRLLPAAVADQVLARLPREAAAELRGKLAAAGPPPRDVESQQRLLREFFELHRNTAWPTAAPPPSAPAAPATSRQAETIPTTGPAPAGDSIQELRALAPAAVMRAIDPEPAPVVAAVVALMEPAPASDVMKRLPAARRSDVAVCLSRPTQRHPRLQRLLAGSVVATARRLADIPPEPTPEERARAIAAVLRRLDRGDRSEALTAIERTDPKIAGDIRQQLFQFDDVLVVPDRGLQELLTRIELRTLATALKGADSGLQEKVLRNLSSRMRQLLLDEIGAQTSVTPAVVQEARQRIADALRKAEEEGKITLNG